MALIVTMVDRISDTHRSKIIVHRGNFYLNEFNSEEAFKRWCKLVNLVDLKEDISRRRLDEVHGRYRLYTSNLVVKEASFWSIEEIPVSATKCKGLSNGSIVDCYVWLVPNQNVTVIYRPNPNAKSVYKPLSMEEHINFVRSNGYLNTVK